MRDHGRPAAVAQLAEQRTFNPRVAGSNPAGGTRERAANRHLASAVRSGAGTERVPNGHARGRAVRVRAAQRTAAAARHHPPGPGPLEVATRNRKDAPVASVHTVRSGQPIAVPSRDSPRAQAGRRVRAAQLLAGDPPLRQVGRDAGLDYGHLIGVTRGAEPLTPSDVVDLARVLGVAVRLARPRLGRSDGVVASGQGADGDARRRTAPATARVHDADREPPASLASPSRSPRLETHERQAPRTTRTAPTVTIRYQCPVCGDQHTRLEHAAPGCHGLTDTELHALRSASSTSSSTPSATTRRSSTSKASSRCSTSSTRGCPATLHLAVAALT